MSQTEEYTRGGRELSDAELFAEPIRIGVSTCLLGENVRYDGGHQRDAYILNTLGKYLDFVSVCPEVECGLPVPREAMRLVGDVDNPRLVTQKTGVDHTSRMKEWAVLKLDKLAGMNLCGFIFKGGSPSSGMERVKVYPKEGGMAVKKGVGIFAKAFKERFPLIPTEEDGRLNDPGLRESFVERIFVMQRWRKMAAGGPEPKAVIDFHAAHKLLFMAHSPELLRELGRLVANVKRYEADDFADRCLKAMVSCLDRKATPKKQTNVLHHAMGYFKKDLTADEKQELLELIDSYRLGMVPLVVPVTLVRHYVRKYPKPYLALQWWLHPHPRELKLRNHV